MRFQVPQYIEIEDKIFGPLTFKQFIYLVGSVGICVVIFTFLPKFLAILLSIPIMALGLALTFYKVNERPFAVLVEDFVKYYIGSRLYIWKREEKKASKEPQLGSPGQLEQVYLPKLSESKLKDLTFELDVKNQSNPVTNENPKV